jgi:hypothetical protein
MASTLALTYAAVSLFFGPLSLVLELPASALAAELGALEVSLAAAGASPDGVLAELFDPVPERFDAADAAARESFT